MSAFVFSRCRAPLGRIRVCALLVAWLSLSLTGPSWANAPVRAVAKPVVDVNTVSAAELEQVRGIGPALAARIIAARNSGGKFRDTDDLRRRVRGLGDTNLRRMMAAGLVLSPSARIVPVAAPARERVELMMGNIPAKSEARSLGRIEEIACCGRSSAAGPVPGPVPERVPERVPESGSERVPEPGDTAQERRAADPVPKSRSKR